ncbi:hypothetical protein D3Z39_05925 [Anaerotruncus colihominis]|uniref:Uncharacterized protein n=1 Tax=Anaerotruncus colihominis TaxID=169435 RepID=A0A845RL41_9FIRM|nr:hypothetical protein [Anaerotruncus colihominis]NBI78412.1 hypothetical protein [Anaerotruncus colihominis]
MKKRDYEFLFLILRLFLCAVTGSLVAWWVLPDVYAQRNYFAVGGEWLLILAASIAPLACLRKGLK